MIDVMPVLHLPDATLWTSRSGRGVPMVLCHGGPGLWDAFGPFVPLLEKHHTVYRFDQRACGRSTGIGPYTMKQAVDDLERLRHFWNVDRWVLLGHSFGASLSLAYTALHPERVMGLVYLGGTGVEGDWQEPYRLERNRRLGETGSQSLKALKAEWLRNPTVENERAYCRLAWSMDFADPMQGLSLAEQLFRPDARINLQVNTELGQEALQHMQCLQLETIKLPVLVLHGEKDPRPAWAARRVAELVAGAKWHLLSGAGHHPWLETPDVLLEAVQDFTLSLP